MKVLNISALFLNYVLNELPSISKQKLAWRKFGGANDFDCPCGKAYCSREVVEKRVCVCVCVCVCVTEREQSVIH